MRLFVSTVIMILATGLVYGTELETNVLKTLERKAFHLAQQTQIPHLTEKQQQRLPVLLVRATKQTRTQLKLETEVPDVIIILFNYMDSYNVLEEKAVTAREFKLASNVSKMQRTHALHFALSMILPEKYANVLDPALYPDVEDWELFYKWCQVYMNEFYDLLSQIAAGDQELVEEVFLIDPD